MKWLIVHGNEYYAPEPSLNFIGETGCHSKRVTLASE